MLRLASLVYSAQTRAERLLGEGGRGNDGAVRGDTQAQALMCRRPRAVLPGRARCCWYVPTYPVTKMYVHMFLSCLWL